MHLSTLNLSKALVLCFSLMCVALVATPAFSDQSPPEHSCTQPEKPEKFVTQAQVDAFMEKVSVYQQCINEFIEAQNKACEVHQDAARSALDQWNVFAAEVNKMSPKAE